MVANLTLVLQSTRCTKAVPKREAKAHASQM